MRLHVQGRCAMIGCPLAASCAVFTAILSSAPRPAGLLVITILHSVVLGIVLCVPSAGTLGQDKDYEALVKVITLGDPDSTAIALHRLTATNVRQMFAVDRELLELRKTVPDLETRVDELRRQVDPQGRARSVAVELDAKVYEAMPEIAQILQRQKISGREYQLTRLAGFLAAMWDEAFPDDFLRTKEGREAAEYMMTPALKFWKSMPPALKAEADDWKKAQGFAGLGRGGITR